MKRQNFNVTLEQEAMIEAWKEQIGANSAKDAILQAIQIARILGDSVARGQRVELVARNGERTWLTVPALEKVEPEYRFLVRRAGSWKHFIAGTRVAAHVVANTAQANGWSAEEVAIQMDLQLEAVRECFAYAESNAEYIRLQMKEELDRLREFDVKVAA